MRTNQDPIWKIADSKSSAYFELSDKIWDTPELNYREFVAARLHEELLRQEGFLARSGIAGIPTAVAGDAGQGGPVIAVLGEYDALPGLSQEAGVAQEQPIVAGGSGHGCGHNMLGAAALLAASSLKEWLEECRIPGRVRYYGCPAEEGGSSKGFMVKGGAFDDVDIAICWHPHWFASVTEANSLACVDVDPTFNGRASHAAATPELGRSALDAVELMNVGVELHARAYALIGADSLRDDRWRRHRPERRSVRSRRASPSARSHAWRDVAATGSCQETRPRRGLNDGNHRRDQTARR